MTTSSSTSLDLTKLNLRKDIVLNLAKARGLDSQKAQVALAIDHSGSTSQLYSNGIVQDTLERIVPIAMQFDDNGEFELFVFDEKVRQHPNNVTVSNCAGIVKREFGSYAWGGTNYAPTIKAIMNHYLKPASSGSMFGKIFGSKSEGYDKSPLQYPVYVIFITDGENFDRSEAEAAIIEAANYGIFFQFVGIGSENFNFLAKLDTLRGRYIDNANFFKIKNLATISDNDLYDQLLTEFPSWVTEARSKQLIQ